MATAKKKTRRRLSNLVVREVSLVDRPAVPEATFVVCKRDPGDNIDDQLTAMVNSLSKSISDQAARSHFLQKKIDAELIARGLKKPTLDDLASDTNVVGAIERLASRVTELGDRSAALRARLDKLTRAAK